MLKTERLEVAFYSNIKKRSLKNYWFVSQHLS